MRRVLALALCLVLVVTGSLIYSLQTSVDTLRDRSLQWQAFDIARHLTLGADGSIGLDLPDSLAADYNSALGAMTYAVFKHDGTALFRSPDDRPPEMQLNTQPHDAVVYRETRHGTEFFGYALPWVLGTHHLWIQVEQSTEHDDVLAEAVIQELFFDSGWFIAAACAAVLFIIFLTIRTTLAPVREVSQLAAGIGPGTLDQRLPLKGVPSEITPLVQAVNSALDRIRDGFKAQKDFTANAAHELKTPLAMLRLNLESSGLGQSNPQMLTDLDRMSRVVSQMLRMSEIDSGIQRKFVPTDLREIAVEIAMMLAPLALRENKEVEIDGSAPNMVRGDAVLLHHALRNLVENALAHAPQNTSVVIDISRPGRLAVCDQGPGVPQKYRDQIFERFWRAPGERRQSGAGLGLSIVKAIVAAHGGSVGVVDRADCGACFEITLPQESAPSTPVRTIS